MVDTNKGDERSPEIRAKELKKRDNTEEEERELLRIHSTS